MNSAWRRLNALLDQAIQQAQVFIAANSTLLVLTIAAGVFAHGYQLTHLTFSIDEEVLWQAADARDNWLEQHRWGMYLLQTYVLPQAVYPFTSAALAIVFLSLSCVLLVKRADAPPLARAVFCVLFVSFPTFAHIQIFEYMGAYVAFAILLVVVAERLLVVACCRPSLLFLVPSLFALTIATASHQSLLFVFPTLVMFALTASAFRNELLFRAALRRVILAGLVMVGAVLVYSAVDRVLGLRSTGYVEGYFRWGSLPPLELLANLYRSAIPFLAGEHITYATMPTLIVPALVLIVLAIRSERPSLTCGVTIALIISPLAVHLAFGTWMPSRSMMAFPFAFAGLWYLLFSLGAPAVRVGVMAFTFYALSLHSSTISKVSLTQELTYKADTLVASRILDLIFDAAPRLADDGTPLAFIGELDPPRSKLFTRDEVFGGSFWQWDGGNPYRMHLFLKSLGLPITVMIAPPSEWPRAVALSQGMPAWPDRNCVQFRGGLVIVKLSEASGGNP